MNISPFDGCKIFSDTLDLSPIGKIHLILHFKNNFLLKISLLEKKPTPNFPLLKPSVSNALRTLLLAGETKAFPFPVFFYGTSFQKKVWAQCLKIPRGKTSTYGEIAKKIGCKSPRAVGQALKQNPLPIIIPCHRVLGKGQRLTGFSGGLFLKKTLLEFEKKGKLK